MFEPNNEPTFVDPNTDDLDEFSKLLSGNAKVKEEAEPEVNEDDSNDDDTVTETETTEVEDTESEETHDDEETEEEAPKPKKVNKVQERINKVLERERLARERADALEAKIAELTKTQETAPKQAAPEYDGPTPEDKNEDGSEKYPLGEYDPNYIRDLTRHTLQKEQAELREQEAKESAIRQEKEAREQLHNEWVNKLKPAQEKYEDFLDKTMELEDAFDGLDPQYSDYLASTIKSLDHGPDVLYYFANHLDEAKEFVKMGPLKATLALGELNAMFKGNPRKETKVSKAPPPPQINKGAKTRSLVSPDTDNLDDFEKLFFKKR